MPAMTAEKDCHCEPPEGRRGNLVFKKEGVSETDTLKTEIASLNANAFRLASMGIGF